jgi:hypothetical protein
MVFIYYRYKSTVTKINVLQTSDKKDFFTSFNTEHSEKKVQTKAADLNDICILLQTSYLPACARLQINAVFWLENLKGRDGLENLRVDGKIILKWTLRKYGGTQWRAVVNTVMNLRAP